MGGRVVEKTRGLDCLDYTAKVTRMNRECTEDKVINMESVTAIIPAYNCEDTISICIDSLLDLREEFDGELEILVVFDTSSVDNTGKKLGKYKDKVRIIKTGHQTPPEARNYGACLAKFDILFFVDSDNVYDRKFLSFAIESLSRCNAVMGMFRVFRPNSFYKKLKDLDLKVRMSGSYKVFALSKGWIIRKKDFELVTGYNDKLEYGIPEDVDLVQRLRAMGLKICFEPLAKFYEIERGFFNDLSKFYRMGQSYARTEFNRQIKRITTSLYLSLVPISPLLALNNSVFLLYLIPFIVNFVKTYRPAKICLFDLPFLILFKFASPLLVTSLLLGYFSYLAICFCKKVTRGFSGAGNLILIKSKAFYSIITK